jgi:signal transduction histidine kinase
MNDTSMRVSPSFQLELETLRDQRDLYRSLLLSEPMALANGMTRALASVRQIQSLLQSPTRESAAFRGKIELLLTELEILGEALLDLHLPTVSARLQSAQGALREIELRAQISGNDLLPAMVVLGELCTHISIAADSAAVHVPVLEEGPPAEVESFENERRAPPQLLGAVQRLTASLSQEHGKDVVLEAKGLQDIPEQWVPALFDVLAQLVRNAIEHGIESRAQRLAQGKPERATLAVQFASRASGGYELSVQDDGGGLDVPGIAQSAVRLGLLPAQAAQEIEGPRLVGLIFQPGISTAEPAAKRGQGLQIVREHLRRLGGGILALTKRGRYTRFQIELPALAVTETRMASGA